MGNNSEVAHDEQRLARSNSEVPQDNEPENDGSLHEAERGSEMQTEAKKLYPDFLEHAIPAEDDVKKA